MFIGTAFDRWCRFDFFYNSLQTASQGGSEGKVGIGIRSCNPVFDPAVLFFTDGNSESCGPVIMSPMDIDGGQNCQERACGMNSH